MSALPCFIRVLDLYSFGEGFRHHKKLGLLHPREAVRPGNLLEPIRPWTAQFLRRIPAAESKTRLIEFKH